MPQAAAEAGVMARPPAAGSATIAAGQAIYQDVCAACHRSDGAGEPGLFPALRRSAIVAADDPAFVLDIIIHGARSPASDQAPTAAVMPSFGRKLDDRSVAAVASFIRNAWGDGAAAVSPADVARYRRGGKRR
jgi:mono/diheme cytochrome c family protein